MERSLLTSEVATEFRLSLPSWILVRNPTNILHQKILLANIDKGEATSIALAIEIPDSLLIIDDLKGRHLADELGIRYTGTLGLLIAAKSTGKVKMIGPILRKIQDTDFRISSKLEILTLTIAGET